MKKKIIFFILYKILGLPYRRHIKLKEYGISITRFIQKTKEIHKRAPQTPKGKFLLRTDNNGYILNDTPRKNGPNIFLIGDSFIECSLMQENERIAAQLEKKINCISPVPLNIINAGMSAMSTLSAQNLLLNKMVANNPALLILTTMSTDIKISTIKETYWNFDKTCSNLGNIQFQHYQFYQQYNFSMYHKMLSVFLYTTKLFHIPTILLLKPIQSLKHEQKLINEYILKNKNDFHIPIFDFTNSLLDNPRYFYDRLHLTPLGANKFSECIIQSELPLTIFSILNQKNN